MRIHCSLVAQDVLPSCFPEIQLDPGRVEVEGYRIRPETVREDSLEFVESDDSVSVEIKVLECDLCERYDASARERRTEVAPLCSGSSPQNREMLLTSYSASGFFRRPSKVIKSSQLTRPALERSAMRNRMPYCARPILAKSEAGAIALTNPSSPRYLRYRTDQPCDLCSPHDALRPRSARCE